MKKLYLYTIFHANLSFSSIPKDQYSLVIDKCYWPLLEIVEDLKIPIGVEFPSHTLKEIEMHDATLIKKIKELWDGGTCELIGSGFTQSIFPLSPVDANIKNLELGNTHYFHYFARVPNIAFLNEMTYSLGLLDIYIDAGYKGVIMDWDNACEYNLYPSEYKYRPCFLKSKEGKNISLLWNSSLTSFKFQRFVHKRMDFPDYIKSVHQMYSEKRDRAFVLYGTDWEVIGYRPGKGESFPEEIERVRRLFLYLKEREEFVLCTPSQILKLFPPSFPIKIESAECPIPCKNRKVYNVTRWAVSGREDAKMNTQCYQLLFGLRELENATKIVGNDVSTASLWEATNYLFSSDFRTSTTEEKYMEFRNRMGEALSKLEDLKKKLLSSSLLKEGDFALVNTSKNPYKNEPFSFKFSFPPKRFYSKTLVCKLDGALTPCQLEDVEYYKDGSIRSALVTLMVSAERGQILQGEFLEGKSKKPNVKIFKDRSFITVQTESVYLRVCENTGADIRRLIFPRICNRILIGYLTPLHYDHIGHSDDYFSGSIHIRGEDSRVYFDTVPTTISLPTEELFPIRVPLSCTIQMGCGKLLKKYYIYTEIPRVDVIYKFYLHDIHPAFLRVCILTFNPSAFSKRTLRYTTVNGGRVEESFSLKGAHIVHPHPASLDVTSTSCLGATEGWVDVADDKKGVLVWSNKKQLYSVPMIEYEQIRDTYLLRLHHSVSETDDTGTAFWRGQSCISFSIMGHGNSLEDVRRVAQNMNQPLSLIHEKVS